MQTVVSDDPAMCNTTPCNLNDAAPVQDAAVMIEWTDPVNTTSSSTVEEEEESVDGMGKLVKDLLHSDYVKVNAALDALCVHFFKDKGKCETFIFWGGCVALVHLVKDRRKKATKKIQACDEVTELNEFAELKTLEKLLCVIISLTSSHDRTKVGITTVGGVEVDVGVMKTFPQCRTLQWCACNTLLHLVNYNIGNKKAIKMGGIEVLLAAVNNHLGSVFVCNNAIRALLNIVTGSKANTELFISLGGATAVAKVRTKWPNSKNIQNRVRSLAKLIAVVMHSWADEK
jgi:hypothetical protein